MDNELDRLPTPTDEDEALQSLDDTTIRPLPEVSAFWEPIDAPVQVSAPTPDDAVRTRRRTVALVGAVAIVSFIAGGFTARMSAQMPVLFAKAPEPVETTAAFEQPAPVTDTTQEPVGSDPEPTPNPPSYDIGYDTTEHSWGDEDDDKDKDFDSGADEQDETDLRWNFDDQGDRSVSYDNDDQRVTVDYDDYSFSFTLDDLLNTDNGSEERNYYEYAPRQRYDSGTGYDSTDAERDSYGWRGYNGTYGSYSSQT